MLSLRLQRKKKTVVKTDNNTFTNRYSHQRIIKGNGGLGGRRTSGDHPSYNIIENDQNTEKSPGDMNRLAVTQLQ